MPEDNSFFQKEIKFAGLNVNVSSKPLLVAEIGLNHNGDTETARKMISAAAKNGANAVKFQSYRTDYFIHPTDPDVEVLRDIFRKYELNFEQHQILASTAEEEGIGFFSTPLNVDWIGKLVSLNTCAIKIASGDINNFSLLLEAVKFQLPLIISTGAAGKNETGRVVDFLKKNNKKNVIFLHCISLYPATEEKINLSAINSLRNLTEALCGFSDHTTGDMAAFGAVMCGAVMVEKHFTLDHSMEGPDHKLSADPQMLLSIRKKMDHAWQMRGDGNIEPLEEELRSDFYGKRSLYKINGNWIALRPRRPGLPLDSDFNGVSQD